MQKGFGSHGNALLKENVYLQNTFYYLIDLMTVSKSHLA